MLASLFTLILSGHLYLFLILLCTLFSQKDVDLSKDDLLGDILQDLHSEVGSFSLQSDVTLHFPSAIYYIFISLFFAETDSSDSSTSCHAEEKEVSWLTYEPLLHKTSDAKGVSQSSSCDLNVEILYLHKPHQT